MKVRVVRFGKKGKTIHSYHRPPLKGEIFCGDAFRHLRKLNDNSAGIIFLDPPFNLGKRYTDDDPKLDRLPNTEYYDRVTKVLCECARVLMPGGTLYLYHLPVWAMRFGHFLEQKSLSFRHWIAISMKNGFVRGRRLYPAHYALLMFTKGEMRHFARPKIRPANCRHCGNLIKDYGGYQAIIKDKGINLSDFWEDLSPVRHANRKHRSGNELPQLLFERIFEISGSPGLLYVDPFAGTGSGVLAAVKAGMNFTACDIVESNCSIIRERLRMIMKNGEEQ